MPIKEIGLRDSRKPGCSLGLVKGAREISSHLAGIFPVLSMICIEGTTHPRRQQEQKQREQREEKQQEQEQQQEQKQREEEEEEEGEEEQQQQGMCLKELHHERNPPVFSAPFF